MGKINWKSTVMLLDDLKQKKIDELNQKCNEAILSKFQSSINGVLYSFSNDNEAQKNFDKAKLAFMGGDITSIGWTVYNEYGSVVRITFDKATFDATYRDHLGHIQSNISKFRDTLQPQVEVAQTIEDIDKVKW